MQNTTQYAACPNCGQSNAKNVGFTWWGGAIGPRMMTHVKCQNCGTEYNGKTGKSNQTTILIYFLATFAIAFCVCGGLTVFSALLNR
jgi:DNA-directed RNA polymerase subunit RPC12/RpoP